MSYVMDMDFDESSVVSSKSVSSDFENSIMSEIMIDAYETNFNLMFEQNAEPLRFQSKADLIKNYWMKKLN